MRAKNKATRRGARGKGRGKGPITVQPDTQDQPPTDSEEDE